MNGLTLYNITGRFFELMARVANDETLSDEEANEQYNELSLLLQQKTPGIVSYYRQMDLTIDAVDAEIKRLTEMKLKMEQTKDKYKQYVHGCMGQMGIAEISTQLGKLKISKCPLSVEVDNLDELPDEFKRTSVTVAPDKNAIKDHFKSTGEILPGTRIINDKTSLKIT